MKKYILAYLVFLSLFTTDAQSLILKSSVGFTDNPSSGYFFSTELGFPINKWIELTPTFTNVIRTFHSDIYYNWGSIGGVSTNITKNKSGELASYIEMYLFVKPLPLLKKENNKFDIGLGFGYGLNSYEKHGYYFLDENLSGIVSSKGMRLNYGVRAYLTLIRDSYNLGLLVSAIDLADEGHLLVGLQISKNLN